ncbi:hypothetical protein [Pelobacter seleniigenes]|uniref:hypothetical protein n=1 Tax=Pelobacter seleniigenes TaxID=407188 RepID=UPI0004A77626|nr:hypothetical protein [Pelobacter seleniigenes]
MFTKWKALPLLALLLCSGNLHADELISLKAGYQVLSPEGTIAGSINGQGGKVDIQDDLNLDDSEEFTGEVALQWGDTRLALNYLPIDLSGTGTLSKSIELNGQVFNASTRVNSDLTIDLYDFSLTHYLINFDDLPVRLQLGPELSVKVADAEFSVKDLTTGESASESVTAPIPTIGARGRVALSDFLGVSGRIGYMEFDGNHFMDAEAQVEFSPLPVVGFYAGYRYFDLKIDESDLYVETEISGPFAGALVRF